MSELTIQNEGELKLKFAAALLRFPGDAFKAALDIFGTDTGRALYAASHWLQDPVVLAEKERIVEDGGEMALLPTKADLARKVWEMATDETKFVEFKDRLEALKYYGALRSFVDKPAESKGEGNTNVVAQNVMIVRDHGTNEQWENKLAEQQRKLLENASKPVAH